MDIQKKIIEIGKEIKKCEESVKTFKSELYVNAFLLLDELKKVDGWEVMIKSCEGHYFKYPDKFFEWCEVGFSNNIVYFTKGYSNDDDDYIVLSIDLNKPLEEQVKAAIQEKIDKKHQEEIELAEIELAELERLKKKYPDN